MSPRSAAMAQLNIRMSPAIKQAGDATLVRMGITPTQLVRAIWEKLGLGEEAVDQILVALVKPPAIGQSTTTSAPNDESLASFRERRETALAQIRALVGPPPPPLSEDEMQDLLYEEGIEREQEVLASHAY